MEGILLEIVRICEMVCTKRQARRQGGFHIAWKPPFYGGADTHKDRIARSHVHERTLISESWPTHTEMDLGD